VRGVDPGAYENFASYALIIRSTNGVVCEPIHKSGDPVIEKLPERLSRSSRAEFVTMCHALGETNKVNSLLPTG